MTIAKDFASKLAVAFVAVAMIFSAFATTASAQTTEDLQQMINDLLAQVATLQSQLGGGDSAPVAGVCPYTWTRDLSQGTTGMDVMKLQQFLNADPDTRVAASGVVGSAGMETEYYGPATAAAVSKFQVKYRSEILSPVGLVNPTGYFGSGSRAQANDLCVTPVVDEDDEDGMEDDDEDEMEEDDDVSLGGIASLDTFEIDGASDDEIEEGAEDAPVAEVTVEFTNGDAEISIMDVSFAAGNADAWDVLDEVSLWVDGDKIAEVDASDEDDYLNEKNGTLRFTGLDLIAMEDEEVEVTIAVSTRGSIDSADQGTYTVSVDSMRFFDADGVATTENSSGSFGDFGTPESFSIEEAGYEDEIRVRTSSNDPDSTTLQLEDNSDSEWYTVFVFDIDTDDSENDIEINEVPVTVNLSSSTYNAIVDDAELVIDGTTIDDVTVTNGGTASATLTFDVDGDVVINAGDRVEAELRLSFKALDAGNEGMNVDAEITTANVNNIDAEGADDLENSPTDQLTGSAGGELHTLRTSGVDISPESTDATVTSLDGADNDYATYEIEVEVTAFNQDVFINTDDSASVAWELTNSAGAEINEPTASTTVVLSSTAEENGSGYFEINEGETETLTLTVTYSPGNAASISARLLLESITFDEDASSADQTQTTLPKSSYRTAVVTIVN